MQNICIIRIMKQAQFIFQTKYLVHVSKLKKNVLNNWKNEFQY